MQKIILLFLFTSLFKVSFGQPDIESIIIGEWRAIDQFGDSGTIHFDVGKTMWLTSPKGDMGRGETILGDKRVKTLMKYELNTNEKPYQLDFYYYVDNFFNPIGKSEGIVEILDNNTIWLAMNYNRPPTRPKDFKNIKESGIIFRSNVENKVEGCEKFKNGKFLFTDPVLGIIKIERKDDIQIQENEKGEKIKFKVQWIDDCTYSLTPLESFSNNQWTADTSGVILSVKIVKTREESYIYTSSFNKSKFRLSGELIKVDTK